MLFPYLNLSSKAIESASSNDCACDEIRGELCGEVCGWSHDAACDEQGPHGAVHDAHGAFEDAQVEAHDEVVDEAAYDVDERDDEPYAHEEGGSHEQDGEARVAYGRVPDEECVGEVEREACDTEGGACDAQQGDARVSFVASGR